MTLNKRLIKVEKSAKARTNIFDLKDDLIDIIECLLKPTNDKTFITYNFCKFKRGKDEEKDKFEIRIHREIKSLIRDELHIEDKYFIHYETIRKWEDVDKIYFFYISNQQTSKSLSILEDIKKENIDKRRIIQGLIGLRLKMNFIEQVSERNEFPPLYFNSELYLSVTQQGKVNKKRIAFLDGLIPTIYFSKTNELIVTLHKKTFKTEKIDGIPAQLEDTRLFFRNKKNTFCLIDQLNATRYSKKKFMTFSTGYSECINFSQHLIANTLARLLDQLNISYSERYFQSDFELNDFLTLKKYLHHPVVVIDNIGEKISSNIREEIYNELKKSLLQPLTIVSSNDYSSFRLLDKQKNYLILNSSLKSNGSSIKNIKTGKIINSSLDAYWQYCQAKKINIGDYDYYTRLKIIRFDTQDSTVIQGVNIDKKKYDKKTKKSYFLSPFKIKKIFSELFLKESIFYHKKIEDVKLPDCKLRLVYIRKLKRKQNNFFSSVVNIRIHNYSLIIESNEIIKTENRLKFYCHFLKDIKLYNQAFYIFDTNNEITLCAYNSKRIPLIIGNQVVDSIKEAEKSKNDKIRKLSGINETPLPYYLLPKKNKQYHRIHLQQQGDNLLFFVSFIQQPNVSIVKQNLIYNLLTFDVLGKRLNALEQEVTDIYFQSFTQDILRLNEVSKSSLLEKIAKLFIEN